MLLFSMVVKLCCASHAHFLWVCRNWFLVSAIRFFFLLAVCTSHMSRRVIIVAESCGFKASAIERCCFPPQVKNLGSEIWKWLVGMSCRVNLGLKALMELFLLSTQEWFALSQLKHSAATPPPPPRPVHDKYSGTVQLIWNSLTQIIIAASL